MNTICVLLCGRASCHVYIQYSVDGEEMHIDYFSSIVCLTDRSVVVHTCSDFLKLFYDFYVTFVM